MKSFNISDENANQRLDKFLTKLLKNANKGFIYKMLRKKNITLNGKKAEGTEIIKVNDEIKIFFSDETFMAMSGQEKTLSELEKLMEIDKRLNIIYEDENMILINKPAGLLSQKSMDSDISVNEIALSYMAKSGELTEEKYSQFHPSVVNRLDRNTSGLIIFAKNLKSAQELSAALKNRSCQKLYRAVVKGQLTEKLDLSGYLLKDEASNKVEILDKPVGDAKVIKTIIEPIQALDNGDTYVEIDLITGKTHQIRAHLASIGHPIAGDIKYGMPQRGLRHQLLHAYSLTLNGKTYIAPLPKEFEYANLEFQRS